MNRQLLGVSADVIHMGMFGRFSSAFLQPSLQPHSSESENAGTFARTDSGLTNSIAEQRKVKKIMMGI
jgi:hypothetical protein